tara:strand:- start:312 stop:437 length:126 start_codon:yes stop_codon:yes gene_type:complete
MTRLATGRIMPKPIYSADQRIAEHRGSPKLRLGQNLSGDPR